MGELNSSVTFGSSCLGSSEFTLNSQETLERVRGVISAEACWFGCFCRGCWGSRTRSAAVFAISQADTFVLRHLSFDTFANFVLFVMTLGPNSKRFVCHSIVSIIQPGMGQPEDPKKKKKSQGVDPRTSPKRQWYKSHKLAISI